MECPRCFSETRVVDSRTENQHGLAVRRRRTCMNCRHRFTTYEVEVGVDCAITLKRGRDCKLVMSHFTLVKPRTLWAEVSHGLPSGILDEAAGE
ncbi:hypothetical protein LCGC14_0772100 [marine sediment metagenome]|uniref:Transcriptional repressor NrdR-like N-terminal domain-containing protein n=1 Tax=marine sediment metagenome TaxID=412755 RepID=A0A0F9QHS9_9ZZZZ